MKVARLHGPGDVRLHDEPDPTPTEGRPLVRVRAVGLCGSDLHWFGEGGIGDATVAEPLVLGHEIAGEIVSGPRAGTRVAVEPAIACRRCDWCRHGDPNLCPDVVFAGHGRQDGGLRELMTWPDEQLFALPDTIGDAEAALVEPLGVALHAFDLAGVGLGDDVAVVGCGPIGLMLFQLARASGAGRLLAIDPLEHRRHAAERCGADVVVAHPDELELGPSGAVRVVLEATDAEHGAHDAISVARTGGRVVLAGIPDGDRTSFRASSARRKGLTLVLSRRAGDVTERAIALAERGTVELGALVSRVSPLSEIDEAFATAAARDGLKVVVRPDGESSGG